MPLIMTVLIIGLLWALYVAITSPSSYEARAIIQVNAPVLSDPLTRSAPPASLRMQQIEQRLMSRGNLVRLIDNYNLFAEMEGIPDSTKLEIMRENTRIQSVAASGGGMDSVTNLSSIIVSARAGTAQTAADIANDLANDVVNSDRRDREARIAEADQFLSAELTRVERDLDIQDRNLATYSSLNEDSMPESRTFLQTEQVSLTDRQAATEQALMDLQRERLLLERTDATADNASIVQQLRGAELALAQARRTLPAGHPEIQRLERTVSAITRGETDTVSTGIGPQLSLIDSQVRKLEDDIEQIRARRLEIDVARNRSGEVLQAYQQMQRDRQNTQDQFADLSRRLAEIESLRLLSQNDQTENMVILEPAVAPEFPVASNRKRSAILGAFGSFAIAAGMALLLDLLNPVLRNTTQFEAITGLRPVIALPYRASESDRFRRTVALTYVVVISVIGLILALWMIDLMPAWLRNMLPPSIKA
ncbi:lipopolysaccharide biosynthesis protein [Paracoccus tegillarcae]|uniref:Lipopolysaccharide biosynthesis protein n=1 Tax=Paracoccus tegillarcae TaxID=1529068 RepID=A0A2K9EH45_9RHOB|nr:lipopolysaccharide biosynthesis protein [Paracoccus tegillarcae]